MPKRKKIFLSILGISACLIFLADAFFWKVVRIDGRTFLAQTPVRSSDYAKGLGGRKDLSRARAMLFKFPRKGEYAFWMKDMNFDLDIIWIADGKVAYIKKNFSHNSDETVSPPVPADKVLEIGAGLADKYGFKVGDRVDIF